MPNLMCNHLIIHGERAVEIMRSVLVESEETDCGYEFDFEKIVPMPEELNMPVSLLTENCARLYINGMVEYCEGYKKYSELFKQAYNGDYFALTEEEQNTLLNEALTWKNPETHEPYFKNKAEVYACGKQALDNYVLYGTVDSYYWREYNWGTKWNAYETQINDLEKADIYFNTAGSQATQIIKALSEKYPDHKFEYEYAEGRAGGYAGFYDYENGITVSYADYAEGCKEAYQMYFALWGQEDEYKFNPDKHVVEELMHVDTVEDYRMLVKEFNDKNFKYDDRPLFFDCDDSFFDMSTDYFDKWFSDYVYIKNLSDKPVVFTDSQGRKIKIDTDVVTAFHFGEFIAANESDFDKMTFVDELGDLKFRLYTDMNSNYSEIWNACAKYDNNHSGSYITDKINEYDFVTEDLLEYIVKENATDLSRLRCFINNTYDDNIYMLDGYGNLKNVDISDFENLIDDIVSDLQNEVTVPLYEEACL